jgi:uncharacterized protein (TIGR02996 family)
MPSERDALLAAICAAPDDDTPRLVFADWLDENGSHPWAGLIRAECELARLAADGSAAEAVFRFIARYEQPAFKAVPWAAVDAGVARRVELTLAAKRLWPKARKEIVELVPKKAGLWWAMDTHRGFPATLYPTRRHKVDVGALTRLPPFHLALGYTGEEPSERFREWVADGLLRHVRGIGVDGDRLDLVIECATSADRTGIQNFSLRYSYGAAGLVVRWLTGLNWNGLRELELHASGLEREDAVRLFRAGHVRRVTRLALGMAEGWTRHTVRELDAFTELRELVLDECGLDDAAAEALAALPGLANLRSLTLSENRITGRGATALLTSPHLRNLAVLDLNNNPVRGLNAKALAKAPPGSLRAIRFDGCRLTAADVAAVASSPVASNLVFLDFDRNGLPDAAAARLVAGLGDRAPAILYLVGNQLGVGGAKALAEWPAAEKIHMLHLKENPLGTAGAKALAASPYLKRVGHLCTTRLPAAGAAALKKRFGKRAEV